MLLLYLIYFSKDQNQDEKLPKSKDTFSTYYYCIFCEDNQTNVDRIDKHIVKHFIGERLSKLVKKNLEIYQNFKKEFDNMEFREAKAKFKQMRIGKSNFWLIISPREGDFLNFINNFRFWYVWGRI